MKQEDKVIDVFRSSKGEYFDNKKLCTKTIEKYGVDTFKGETPSQTTSRIGTTVISKLPNTMINLPFQNSAGVKKLYLNNVDERHLPGILDVVTGKQELKERYMASEIQSLRNKLTILAIITATITLASIITYFVKKRKNKKKKEEK